VVRLLGGGGFNNIEFQHDLTSRLRFTTAAYLKNRVKRKSYDFDRMFLIGKLSKYDCRAVAQAVSRRLFTAEARIRAYISPCGICGGQSSRLGQIFLRVLRFSLVNIIPPLTHIHSDINWGMDKGPVSSIATITISDYDLPLLIRK
jgi:hypothetical protein